jgi:single-strand DNA-binding protein
MASGVNKVILVGHLGANPDMRYTPSGAGVCELRLATGEQWTDKSGQRQERTEWHRVVIWGKLAEVCSKYLSKGRQVYVEGRLRTRSYEKDGVKRYTTEIIASDVQFLAGGGGGGRGGDDAPPPGEPYGGFDSGGGFESGGGGGGFGGGGSPDDDIPF